MNKTFKENMNKINALIFGRSEFLYTLSFSLSNKHTYITIETNPNAMYKYNVPH